MVASWDPTAIRSSGAATRRIVAILTAACVLLVGISKPFTDWDVIGYVAAAYQQDGYAGPELLTRTFDDLRSTVDDATFQLLARGGDTPAGQVYRQTVSSDPKALAQQIPLYSIRVAYVGLIRAVGRLGVSYSKASLLIAAVSAALSVLVLSGVLTEARAPIAALPLIAITSGVMEIGRYSSPDSLALLAALAAVLALLRGSASATLFAAILPVTRTDCIGLSLLVLAFQFAQGRRIQSVVGAIVAAASVLLINRLTGNYGWLTLINLADIAITPYPASLHPSMHIADYLRAYAFGLYGFASNYQFLVYALGVSILYWRMRRNYPLLMGQSAASALQLLIKDRRAACLYFIPIGYAAFHIMLFPHYEARYFTFSAALAAIWIFSREPGGAAGAQQRPELAWAA